MGRVSSQMKLMAKCILTLMLSKFAESESPRPSERSTSSLSRKIPATCVAAVTVFGGAWQHVHGPSKGLMSKQASVKRFSSGFAKVIAIL